MKKRAEIAIAALAMLFICFALGYFLGRRSIPSEVSFSTGTVIITPSAVSPSGNGGHAAAAESLYPSPAPIDTPYIPPEKETEPPSLSATQEPAAPAATEPDVSQSPAATEPHYTSEGLLRINYATQQELETLPGIGEVIASRIIEYRDQNGPFARISTLKVIRGIGEARYAAIKDLITAE